LFALILYIVALVIVAHGAALIGRGKVNVGEKGRPDLRSARPAGLAIMIFGIAVIAAASITIVPTRNIAVSMAFGKPTGTLGNGFHMIAPWETTEEYDAAIQTLRLDGDAVDDATPAPTVRLANAATAKVDVTVQWQVDPDADITQLHLDFRNFDNIQDNVVKRQLQAALNAVFEGYDPLGALKAGQSGTGQVTLAELGDRVAVMLAKLLPRGVVVRSVTVPLIRFDPKVQEALDKYQQTLAETQIAEQRQKTNEALRRANDILAGANNTPGVLFQNCLDLTERMAQQGKPLPPAWSCGAPPATVVPVR
jgi:regulator of protease activity HflC (stomatin/prohibitin superfamily)